MKHFSKIISLTCITWLACVGFANAATHSSPWHVRVRGIAVAPQESGHTTVGGDVKADNAYVPELDISYFFTKNIAAELILAVSPHDMSAKDTALGNLDLGDVWLLPPILTLQYHFYPHKMVKPYVGAGINYTVFFDESTGKDINAISYDNSFGYAFQAGVDLNIDKRWSINLDIKKVFLNTDVSINGGAVTADVDLDPWIIGAGVGYKF